MFETIFSSGGSARRRARKGATVLISLALHAAAVAAVIVLPLLRAESFMPGYRVVDAALVSPPIIPGPPPGGRPGRPVKGPGTIHDGAINSGRSQGPVKLRAPIAVPTAIMDEDPAGLLPDDPGGPGVDGGVGDGKAPWIIAPENLPEEVNPSAGAITTIRPPRLVKRVNPDYPSLAIAARVSGVVVIEAVTDIYGRVKETRVISGNALLNAAAMEAVSRWLYEPYLVNGIPHPVRFTVTVTFVLEKR